MYTVHVYANVHEHVLVNVHEHVLVHGTMYMYMYTCDNISALHKGEFPVIRLNTAYVMRCGRVECCHQSMQGGTELRPNCCLGNKTHPLLPMVSTRF